MIIGDMSITVAGCHKINNEYLLSDNGFVLFIKINTRLPINCNHSFIILIYVKSN